MQEDPDDDFGVQVKEAPSDIAREARSLAWDVAVFILAHPELVVAAIFLAAIFLG